MTEYPNVRKNNTCPLCWGAKPTGLLICWPCHHKEPHHADGRYSESTENLLDAWDSLAYIQP